MEYKELRRRMVEEQLICRGIKDSKVLNAFYKIERHKFVPENLKGSAYSDFPLPVGEGQTISQPYIVALMTEFINLTGEEKVLEIGTGSGYQAAILAELAKNVYTIERFDSLAIQAKKTFEGFGYSNINVRIGDGTIGWPEESPFDRIIITAATPNIPTPLIEQLKENGKLILPLEGNLGQILTLIQKKKGRIETSEICGCVFVPLVGKYALRSNLTTKN